jgi:hypothetical protein
MEMYFGRRAAMSLPALSIIRYRGNGMCGKALSSYGMEFSKMAEKTVE